MDQPSTDVDPELLYGFIDEAMESLETLDALFVELERTNGVDVIQAIFRPIHSIKGNASFFNLVQVRGLAHDMEQVLDQARRGNLSITQTASDQLLAGVDNLKKLLLQRRVSDTDSPDTQAIEDLRNQLRATATSKGPAPVRSPALAISAGTRHPAATALAKLGQDSGHVLAELDRLPSWAANDATRAAVASFRIDFDAIVTAVGWSEVVVDLLKEQLPRIQNDYLWQDPEAGTTIPATVPTTTPAPSALQQLPTAVVDTTSRGRTGSVASGGSDRHERDDQAIRVPTGQIDGFLSQVGELLVLGDLLAHVEARLTSIPEGEAIARDLRQALTIYQQVATNLRQSVMGLRQVPAKRLLQKVPRLVRDVATARGKDIAVVLTGEGLALDKAVLELLDAPIVHLVRNAADHGIESPATRTAAGKSAQGTIRVTIAETETSMRLTVEDDGGGLDLARIKAKAVETGLVAPGAALTRDDIVNFIFASGVSTATEVSDISGRGVGLDVVRRAIEGAGGRIEIDTEADKGTRFSINVPKGARTQIMAGFLVGVSGRCFILPLDRVVRAVALTNQHLRDIPDHGQRLLLDDQTYPHHHLGTITDAGNNGSATVAVLVRVGRIIRSLGVDEVLGVRQVLVRPIEGRRLGPMIAGGAVMGNGSVAVVLNPDEIPGL